MKNDTFMHFLFVMCFGLFVGIYYNNKDLLKR